MASDFWYGANDAFDKGVDIGADVYLKKLAAKIQARNQDKQNLWESIKAEKDKADKAAEWDRQQRITSETNQRWTQTQAERTANEQFDAVNYLIDAKGYRDKIGEFPKTTAGVEAAKARMKELDEAAKPQEKKKFDKEEFLYNKLGPDKYLEYLMKNGGEPEARKPEQARIMAQDIIGKEEGTLPDQVEKASENIDPASKYYEQDKANLDSVQGQLNTVRANRPGGLPALTDSLRLGQGQYATPEQQNQFVDPQKEMSILEKIAAMNAKLDAFLQKVNGGK